MMFDFSFDKDKNEFVTGMNSEREACINIHEEIIVPIDIKDIDSFWSGVIAYREAIRRRSNDRRN